MSLAHYRVAKTILYNNVIDEYSILMATYVRFMSRPRKYFVTREERKDARTGKNVIPFLNIVILSSIVTTIVMRK